METALSLFQRTPIQGNDNPFRLRSCLSEPASSSEIQGAWQATELPKELAELWATSRTARLFEDIDYGQWGLAILDPTSSAERTRQERERRPSEFQPDDVVVGEFLGDQELLVLAPSESGSRRIMIALPLDGRVDWFAAAPTLAEFVEAYFAAGGNKFWERKARH